MKISTKKLNSFNLGKEPSGNENFNIANNIPSHTEYCFLKLVADSIYGIIGKKRKITQKDIEQYIPYTQSQLNFINRIKNK